MNQKMKKGKKLTAVLILTAFLLGIFMQPAFALDFGVYTASTTTNYLNPDTGVTEDGGSQNVELGEGMCRSAVGDTALIEVDVDGNVYVTMRMLLYSNLSKIKFYTQSKKGGSYSAVSASITAENAGSDSADFRFKVPSAGCNIKTSMYVAPMGRDVTFFWNVNSGNAKSGSGDFVVNIDLNAKAKEEPKETVKVETKAEATAAVPATAPVAAQNSATPEPTKVEPIKEEDKTDDSKVAVAENNTAANKTDQTVKTDDSAKPDEVEKNETDDANTDLTEPVDNQADPMEDDEQGNQSDASADEDSTNTDAPMEPADENESSSNMVLPVIVVVIIVAAIGGYVVIKRK